jgi:transcriptional regulator of acetoin/glycerol metabolism
MSSKKPGETDLRNALEFCDGSPTRVAQFYGVTRATVYRWMESYGIKRRVTYHKEDAA